MFCPKCGADVPNNVKFCGSCGNVMEQSAQSGNAAPPIPGIIKKRSPLRKLMIPGAAVIIAIIVLISIISATSNAYEKPVGYAIKALNTSDATYVLKAIPAFYIDSSLGDDEDVDELIDELNSRMKSKKESFKDAYGKNLKVTYEVTDKVKLDKEELADLSDTFSSHTEKSIKVQNGYELKVKLTISGIDNKNTSTSAVEVVKIDGKWFLNPYSKGLLNELF
jgi:uncharacterized membrane protein YvbJ